MDEDEYSLNDVDSINLLAFWVKNNAIGASLSYLVNGATFYLKSFPSGSQF